jgi:hypothetical protein
MLESKICYNVANIFINLCAELKINPELETVIL